MPVFLGIDTSNYTTSAALYDPAVGMVQQKKLLPVKSGACGLRQSDAVFHHVQQMPAVLEQLLVDFDGTITAVGVSSRPRDAEGSYMPCFTVGLSTAKAIAAVQKCPLYTFSHQNGHIAAAVYSSGQLALLSRPFLAFHVSGGTTEAVLVTPNPEQLFTVTLAAQTLDLNAGQLIDRIGVMLGLDFPCGQALEQLAAAAPVWPKGKATLKGTDCCLSGIENICRKAYENGASKEETAALCLACVEKTLDEMCRALLAVHGNLPILMAGGVMSNRLMRDRLTAKYPVSFADPAFSADNAAGIAFLCGTVHNYRNS